MASRLEAIPLWAAEPVAQGGTLTSAAIACRFGDPEYLMFQVTATSENADVRIEFTISNDGVTFNAVAEQDDIVTSTATEFASPKGPEALHVLTCPSAPWIKILVTEATGTNDNTLVTATLWMRNDVAESR